MPVTARDRVPDQALGADALSLRSMRWVMASWERVQLMNRYFGGTLAPRLQLDLLPGRLLRAHFALVARRPPEDIDDYVHAGEAVQRFWLTATTLGLQLQPQYTPLAFAEYVRRRVEFTSVESAGDAPHGSNDASRACSARRRRRRRCSSAASDMAPRIPPAPCGTPSNDWWFLLRLNTTGRAGCQPPAREFQVVAPSSHRTP